MKIPETEGTVHLSPAAGKPKQEEESDYVALPLQNQYDSIFIIHTHAAGREWILAWLEIKGTWGRHKAAMPSFPCILSQSPWETLSFSHHQD